MHVHPAKSTPQLNPGTLSKSLKWRGSVGNCMLPSTVNEKAPTLSVTKLGPGQVYPKGRFATPGRYGELQVGFLLVKGVLEIEVFPRVCLSFHY